MAVEIDDPDVDCFVILREERTAGFAAVAGAEVKHFGVALEEWESGAADRCRLTPSS